MRSRPNAPARWYGAATMHGRVGLSILLGCLAWACWRGQDVNWDLQNYHLYDPFALLHWRGVRDASPAGPQSYLNPLPYLLPYLAVRTLPPLAAGLTIAASQGIALVLAWRIAWVLRPRLLPALLATLVASTGPVVLIELGTSFADLVLAIPTLTSILLLLDAPNPPRRAGFGLLLAGGLTGLAIGMKPTNLFLLPALVALGAMLQRGPGAPAARASAMILAGALLGALLSDGIWAAHLWHSYGSPMFPFMNTVFKSHAAARVDHGDPRFRFIGWRHALAIPFELAVGSDATGEMPIRDGRLVAAACLAVLRLSFHALFRRSRGFAPLDAVCAYVLIGLAGWLVLCPVERYAAVLEILSGLLAILLLAELRARIPAAIATGVAALLLVSTTQSADYFHRSWSNPGRLRVPAAIPRGATYGLLTYPLGIWVTARPAPARSFGLFPTLLENGGVLQRRVDRMIEASGNRLWLLSLDQPILPQVRNEMRIHGIVRAPPCLRTASLIWIDAVFCRGMLTGPRPLAASDLPPDQWIAFSATGDGLIYEISGFAPTGADGTWGSGHASVLAVHLDVRARASGGMLSLRLAGLYGAPARHVTIIADAAKPVMATLGPPSYAAVSTVCLPPEANGAGTVTIRLATDDARSATALHLGIDTRPLSFKLYAMRLRPTPCGAAPG